MARVRAVRSRDAGRFFAGSLRSLAASARACAAMAASENVTLEPHADSELRSTLVRSFGFGFALTRAACFCAC